MKCKKCGGNMQRVDEKTMKCEKCGDVVNDDENKTQ